MSQYRIALKNCAFFARHGVYSEEEALGQRFFVDANLLVNGGEALEDDNIEGTVDYGKAFILIERIVTGRRRYLIESLAREVARAICAEFPMVESAEITIRKPNAPVPGVLDHVAVTVTHERDRG
ncbi:MAG: dihydroneopterin aldolase [Nitratireductor sp.]|nr:dihydroneopterin aldolase [Nitratireductor sp.]MCB1456252.1 dihydroneopterin aldolase [Nitratireductor sp.]MCB1458015.1 dihydroneopterin aldolase [Nitratireductor sp.]